jgi:hypothetical protein
MSEMFMFKGETTKAALEAMAKHFDRLAEMHPKSAPDHDYAAHVIRNTVLMIEADPDKVTSLEEQNRLIRERLQMVLQAVEGL